jgi:hypothetical protein
VISTVDTVAAPATAVDETLVWLRGLGILPAGERCLS